MNISIFKCYNQYRIEDTKAGNNMSEMEYRKTVKSTTGTNLGSISFNTGNIVGYNKTVSSSSSSRGNGSSASTATTMDLTYLLTDNIDETVTSERIADSRKYNTEKGWLGKIGDAIASTGATIGVGVTSILSGVADIGEAILDGGAWVSAKVIGIFNEDVQNHNFEAIKGHYEDIFVHSFNK